MRDDTRILQAGVHVVVGTPGRVYDMLRRRALRADRSVPATLPSIRCYPGSPTLRLLHIRSIFANWGFALHNHHSIHRCSCRIKMFVLDEADEMLSRGFKDQIYDIFQLMPPNLQVCPKAAARPNCCLLLSTHTSPLLCMPPL